MTYERINDPIEPDMVLFGLIFVNFFPPKVFPNTYPPISVDIQIRRTKGQKEPSHCQCRNVDVAKKTHQVLPVHQRVYSLCCKQSQTLSAPIPI